SRMAEHLLHQALMALKQGHSDEAKTLARRARSLDHGRLADLIEELAEQSWRYLVPENQQLQRFYETVRKAANAVCRKLGTGLRPDVYRTALTLEFANRHLRFETNATVKVAYQGGEFLTSYQMDWLFPNRLAVVLGEADNAGQVQKDLAAMVRLARLEAGIWLVFPAERPPQMGWVLSMQSGGNGT
ncbi:MAG TPA: GxxExxY protein, partial [Methylothermaceae bacterium]|nr:GxxExxY protein [Methylothermaceae bacterium]